MGKKEQKDEYSLKMVPVYTIPDLIARYSSWCFDLFIFEFVF